MDPRCPACNAGLEAQASVCSKCGFDFSKLPKTVEPPPTPAGRPRPEPPQLPIDDATIDLVFRALKLDTFLPGLTADQFRKLFPGSGLYLYAPSVVILRQGRTGRDLYVLCSGGVRVQRVVGESAGVLGVLGPGDIFGEIAFLDDCPRTATVIAVEASKVFRLAYADLQYILASNPILSEHLRRLAGDRKP